MPLLKVLAVVVGIIAGLPRLVGVFAPEVARKMLKTVLDRKLVALILMVVAAVIGALFIWAFRLYYAQNSGVVGWPAWVLLGFGIFMAAFALLGLVAPNLLFALASKFYVCGTGKLRVLCLLGVVVAAVIVLLGLML